MESLHPPSLASIVSGGTSTSRHTCCSCLQQECSCPPWRDGKAALIGCDCERVAASSSKGPGKGDAACVCPAQPPPLEMNMPGRSSCSMLNCFVSAFSSPPRCLSVCMQGCRPGSLSGSCPEAGKGQPSQTQPVLELSILQILAPLPALDLPGLDMLLLLCPSCFFLWEGIFPPPTSIPLIPRGPGRSPVSY